MKLDNHVGCICKKECMTEINPDRTPSTCPSKRFEKIKTSVRQKYKEKGSVAREYWQAFSKLVGSGGAQRSRLEHIMEFSRAAGIKKIGLAGCTRYIKLMHTTCKVLEAHGFEAMHIVCKVHGNHFNDIDIDLDSDWTLCNPLGQVMLLNEWKSQLNVQFGLCMGHDLIFNHYSHAPVTVLVVKEKISDDSPVQTIKRIEKEEYQLDPYMIR